ncbi:ABC transporter permease [Paenibacillus donghaensis]|uniref:ABC transporter n=1 Tax=Paenibacillus donghaensis TaxID=414771 RepID=A0A2Z2KJS5_9BACL|nr:ABC transporter permease [Paenibacillus donghaensis]ASA24455.1 ABC transporter [Paenibacillus donghaensis]
MNKILAISWNMVRRSIGSKKGFLAFIILPCFVVAGIVAVTGKMGPEPATVLYVNADHAPGGDHLLEELQVAGGYELVEAADEAELKEAITNQQGEAGIVIPADYTQGLLAGESAQLTVYELKASEASIMLRMKLEAIGSQLQSSAALAGMPAAEAGEPHEKLAVLLKQAEQHRVGSTRTDYNLYPREGQGIVTGLTLLFLMGLVTSSVSLIMDDRRGRTMMRMFSAPVRAHEIALGNFLGSFMVGLIQIMVVLMLGRWVMRYDYETPMYLYFLVLAMFMLVSMGLASTVAGLIRNPNNAGMMNALILTPTCMLGGCFWPLSIMPDYMQKAANFVPQKWAIQAIDVAATGGGWNELWLPFAVLGLMAAILLAIGSAILRPSEAGISA